MENLFLIIRHTETAYFTHRYSFMVQHLHYTELLLYICAPTFLFFFGIAHIKVVMEKH